MERVVAWPGEGNPGYVNLHWSSPKGSGMRGKPFKDVHSFMNMAQYAAMKPAVYKELYYCLSTQSQTGKLIHGNLTAQRIKQNALLLKAIWLDVDVKKDKGYATLAEALDGIEAFYRAANLPPPSAIIFSGGGVHVYWISDKPLTPSEWRPYAEGLKSEALRLGLKCDAGLTTDEARVLRVPGTWNNKTFPAKPVRVGHLGDCYDFAATLAHLAALVPAIAAPVTIAVTGFAIDEAKFPRGGMHPLFAHINPQYDSLADGIDRYSDAPLKIDEVIKHCEHFQEAAATKGASHSEPLWNLTLLASTWLEDGRQMAHRFSKGHLGYSPADTDTKYDQKLTARARGTGWPACTQFEAAGAKCKTCPFFGKLKSPLNLAERITLPGVQAHPVPIPPADLALPIGYTVDNGIICKIVQKEISKGVVEDTLMPLFMSKVRTPILQRGTRKFMFETSLDGGTYGLVSLPEEALATEQTLVKAIRLFGCKPYPDNQRGLVQFMTSWMAKLDAEKRRIETVSFGWLRKDEGGEQPIGFAYGGKVVLSNGTEQVAGFSDAEIERAYSPKGSIDPWRALHKIITDQNHAPIEVIAAMAFAAPLMRATKLYNGVLCPYSPVSGAHKSTSVASGAGVWGSPVLTKERPTSSPKGLMRRMGHIRNLPLYVDEISEPEDMDRVRLLVNSVTEGSDGTKLHNDRTMHAQQDWQTLMMVCSNQSLYENIARNVKSTDAKLQRIFEFVVPPRDDSADPTIVADLVNALDYNYGHMGLLYSGILGRDPAGIETYVKDIHAKFNREVAHVSPERYRSAMAAATFAGASLANTLGCTFHLDEMWSFLKEQYLTQRDMIAGSQSVGGTADNTLALVTQFIKSCVDGNHILTVQHMPVRRKGHPAAIAYISGPTAQRPASVHIRLSQTDRIIELSRDKLEKYLTTSKALSSGVISGLKEHFGAAELRKVDLATGAGVQGGRETVISIPVPPGSPFEGMLFTNAPIDTRPVAMEDEAPITAAVTQAAKDFNLVMKPPQ